MTGTTRSTSPSGRGFRVRVGSALRLRLRVASVSRVLRPRGTRSPRSRPLPRISGSHFSPWSKRILNRVRGLLPRWAHRSIRKRHHPSIAGTHAPAVPRRPARRFVNGRRGGARRLRAPARDHAGEALRVGRAGNEGRHRAHRQPGAVPQQRSQSGRAWSSSAQHLDLFNGYLPYFSRREPSPVCSRRHDGRVEAS